MPEPAALCFHLAILFSLPGAGVGGRGEGELNRGTSLPLLCCSFAYFFLPSFLFLASAWSLGTSYLEESI